MTTKVTSNPARRPPADHPPREPVRPGQRVRNLFSGETMTFHRTSAESHGQLIELDLELRPLGAPGGAPHRHLPAERLEITEGALCVWIAGRPPRLVQPGKIVEVPSGRWHFLVALRHSRARVSVRPGMRFDELLVDWAKLGTGRWRPSLLARVVPLLREHGCL